jgi:hypothetical protein
MMRLQLAELVALVLLCTVAVMAVLIGLMP